jgi:hypothetical protein
MLVADEVSSARHYYKLTACFFGKRYRTLVDSPTLPLSLFFSWLLERRIGPDREQKFTLSGFGMPNAQIEFVSTDRKLK